MGYCRSAGIAVLAFFLLTAPAIAQDVTLTSRDGSVKINGTLLGYDGEFYRVDSVYGELTVDGTGVLCDGPGCPDLSAFVANITLSGSPTIATRLMPALIDAFASQQDYQVSRSEVVEAEVTYELTEQDTGNTVARFLLHVSSSDEGFADLLAEEAEIAMSLRAVTPEEVLLGQDAGLGRFSSPAQNRVVALDALVPVVSPRNNVQEISPENLALIFSGGIRNWQQVGGIDAPIDLYLPSEGSGVLQVFQARIMAPSELQLSPNITRMTTTAELVRAVQKNPFAIGLTTLSELGNTRSLGLTGGCGFRASAVPEAIKSDDYPLTVPLFLYLRAGRLPAIGREFMRFIESPAAQISVLRAGFVDQGISRTPLNRQGDRLANAILAAGEEVDLKELQRMVGVMSGSRRLSITFRFDGGASELNAQSRSNVALLARALETGTIGAKEVTFVGFSDGVGGAAGNQRLSRQRAASVRAAIRKEAVTADPGRVKLRFEGFGEAMPMACDDSEWGRLVNRRVEVWVR